MIVRQRALYFRLANIQESTTVNALQQSRILSRIAHPNIANIYGVYSYNDKLSLVTEHLDISLADFECLSCELEEWEIATITTEVRMLQYILFTRLRA
jgi:serine/threonine protein kinase